MTYRMILVTILLVNTLAGARADVTMDGPLVVRIDDEQDTACTTIGPLPCLFTFNDTGTQGNSTIDARKKFHSVGIGFEPSYFPVLAPLLPSYAIYSEGSDIYVQYEAIDHLVKMYERIPQNRPNRDLIGVDFSRENVSIYVLSPSIRDPAGQHGNRSYGMGFGEGQSGMYDHLGPFNSNISRSTDRELAALYDACHIINESTACPRTANATWGAANSTTPNLLVGIEWENVTIATNSSMLTPTPPHDTQAPASTSSRPHQDVPPASYYPTSRAPPSNTSPGPGPQGPSASRQQEPQPNTPAPALDRTNPPPEAPELTNPLVTLIIGSVVLTAIALFAFALYSRFTSRASVLTHPVRLALLELVKSNHGIPVRVAAAQLALQRNAILHHVDKLERASIIRREEINGRTVLFLSDVRTNPAAALRIELAHPTRGPILRALERAPDGLTRAALHAAVSDMPVRTRNHTIMRLKEMGLIEEGPDGAKYRLTANKPGGASA